MARWGRTLVHKDMGGYALQVFAERPRRLADILDEAAKWGAREFLVHGENRWSFAAFLRAVDAAADTLSAAGVRARAPVLLLAGNCAEHLLAFWALARLDAVVALGNAWWSAEEIAHAIALTQPRLIVCDAPRRERLPRDAAVFEIETLGAAFESPAGAARAGAAGDEEEPALLVFTSGTTSAAKAACLSHRAALACLHVLYAGRDKTPSEFLGDEPQAHFLCCAPLFHISGYMSHTQALLSGHRFVLVEGKSDPARILALIEAEAIHVWATVPTLLQRVMQHPEAATRDLSSVQTIAAGGAVVTPALMDLARSTFPNAQMGVAATYGLTETGGSVTAIAGDDYRARPNASGRPLPGCEIRIADPDADGVGEIVVRTPSMMTGYWREPPSVRDGWLHTGDLGRLDEEGFLTITGRAKDVIIRGGENVAAARVEACLERHPDVREVAVIGLPHADLGEEVAAIVVSDAADLNEAALAQLAAQHLAYFERPTRWWLRRDPLPTNATSKVLKAALREAWLTRDPAQG
ncbi:MAG: AMP-binding protein [Alphaproteobacteria bacterium]|nr:AMP-binding protein [Alphaproteobacteria bacterium]